MFLFASLSLFTNIVCRIKYGSCTLTFQETLVNMGDKPEKFINSRQWIGSVEVGYVLDTWVGAQHRIQFVSSGMFYHFLSSLSSLAISELPLLQ